MASIQGVKVTGIIVPGDSGDAYPVIDPIYGIDGLRNYSGGTEVLTGTTITSLRRRAGMIVGINNGTTFYKLKPGPWSSNLSLTDWELFSLGSTFTGGTVSGYTTFTSGVTSNTISATTYFNVFAATGGTYSNGTISLSGTGSTALGQITGLTTPFTGGTVSGVTIFQSGLTANTISANTISATYYEGVTGKYLPLSGGTVTGGTTFTSGLTANIITYTGLLSGTGTTITSGVTQNGVIDLYQTWNWTGATPTAIRLNVTNTNSSSTAYLMDLRTDNTGRFTVNKYGDITKAGGITCGRITQSGGNISAINGIGSTIFQSHFSGSGRGYYNNEYFRPTGGTGTYTAIEYNGELNQTAGASGVTRGVYVNPILTSAYDFRAIEVVTGTTYLRGLTATTISATTYNSYIPLPTTAGSTTGTTITFITDRVYGTTTLPISGSPISGITDGGQIGVTNIIIHNNVTTPPSFSSNMKKLSGSSSYVINTINYIYCTYIDSSTIIYSINQITP